MTLSEQVKHYLCDFEHEDAPANARELFDERLRDVNGWAAKLGLRNPELVRGAGGTVVLREADR